MEAPNYVYYTQTYTGVVCRYDWRRQFGFINVIATDDLDSSTFMGQVFVHVSQIKTTDTETEGETNRQTSLPFYKKKLVTGEVVRLRIAPSQDRSQRQRPQAIDVRGIFGNPLMCEHGDVEFRKYTNAHNYPPHLRGVRRAARNDERAEEANNAPREGMEVDDNNSGLDSIVGGAESLSSE